MHQNVNQGTVYEQDNERIGSKSRRSAFFSVLNPAVYQFFMDFFMIILSSAIFYFIRFKSGFFGTATEINPMHFLTVTSVMLFYWLSIYWLAGLYKNWYIRSPFDEVVAVLKANFFGSLLIFFMVLIDSIHSPRLLFLLYFAIICFFVSIGRITSKKLQTALRRRLIISIPAILVGSYEKVKELQQKMLQSPAWGYRTKGIVLISNEDISEEDRLYNEYGEKIPILGTIEFLEKAIDFHKPHEIIITVDSPQHSLMMNIVALCSARRVNVKIVPDIYDIFTGQVRTLPIYGIPLIEVNTQLLKPWQNIMKQLIDIVFSFMVLVIGSPFWLIFSLVIKLESKGNILYKQVRTGKNGKPFLMVKFRSMVTNADKQGPGWTAVNDSRVTKFGKFIRKTHLDEIPQFWNILKGEMSIVGPRPEQPHLVEKFNNLVPYYSRRFVVQPGLTGWWQVNYQPYEESVNEIENRLKDDFYYIENISLKLDIEIIIRTVICVIKGHGQA